MTDQKVVQKFVSFMPNRDIRCMKDMRTQEKFYSPFVKVNGRIRLLRKGIKHPFGTKTKAANYGQRFMDRYRTIIRVG